jgi:hypothetical protein
MKSGVLVLMSCLFLLMFGPAKCLAQGVKNQTTTYCEDDGPGTFQLDADSLPKAVVDSVMNASESKQMLAGEAGAEVRGKLLHARRIRLLADGATVFLVIGSPPLSAADGSWFWIVREDGAKASVLLWTAGNCVEVKSSTTRGYRDIGVSWVSAGSERTEIYHYDGKAYKLANSQVRDREPND